MFNIAHLVLRSLDRSGGQLPAPPKHGLFGGQGSETFESGGRADRGAVRPPAAPVPLYGIASKKALVR
jgi:hypothetical protein